MFLEKKKNGSVLVETVLLQYKNEYRRKVKDIETRRHRETCKF